MSAEWNVLCDRLLDWGWPTQRVEELRRNDNPTWRGMLWRAEVRVRDLMAGWWPQEVPSPRGPQRAYVVDKVNTLTLDYHAVEQRWSGYHGEEVDLVFHLVDADVTLTFETQAHGLHHIVFDGYWYSTDALGLRHDFTGEPYTLHRGRYVPSLRR